MFSICKAESLLDLLVVKLNGICSGLTPPPPIFFLLEILFLIALSKIRQVGAEEERS